MFYYLECSSRLNGTNFFEYILNVINDVATLPPNKTLDNTGCFYLTNGKATA